MYGQQTFLVHFFAVVSNDDNVKLPCRNFLVTRFMEQMLYVVPFTFFSVPLIFTLVAAGISHFLTAAIKLSCYSSNEIDLLFFFFISDSSSIICYPMKTLKLSRKKESASLLLFFFISKSPGGYAIYCRNARVLEKQNFTPA